MPKRQRLVKANKPRPTRGEFLAMYDQGHMTSEVCTALGVGHVWARRVKQERHFLGKTTTFPAGLLASGWVSPLVIHGALNGALSLNYVVQHLAPALEPGNHLILDNLASHKFRGVRKAIERAGAQVLYNPTYSPDLNPIELAFSKLRRLSRSQAARIVVALLSHSGMPAEAFFRRSHPPKSETTSAMPSTAMNRQGDLSWLDHPPVYITRPE